MPNPIQIAAELNVQNVKLNTKAFDRVFSASVNERTTKAFADALASASVQAGKLAGAGRNLPKLFTATENAISLLTRSIDGLIGTDGVRQLKDLEKSLRGIGGLRDDLDAVFQTIKTSSGRALSTVNDNAETLVTTLIRVQQVAEGLATGKFNFNDKPIQDVLKQIDALPEEFRDRFRDVFNNTLSNAVRDESANVNKEITNSNRRIVALYDQVANQVKAQIKAAIRGGDTELVKQLEGSLSGVEKRRSNFRDVVAPTDIGERAALLPKLSEQEVALEKELNANKRTTVVLQERAAEITAETTKRSKELQTAFNGYVKTIPKAIRDLDTVLKKNEELAKSTGDTNLAQSIAGQRSNLSAVGRDLAFTGLGDNPEETVKKLGTLLSSVDQKREAALQQQVVQEQKLLDLKSKQAQEEELRASQQRQGEKIAAAEIERVRKIEAAREKILRVLEQTDRIRAKIGGQESDTERRLRAIVALTEDARNIVATRQVPLAARGEKLTGVIDDREIDQLIKAQKETDNFTKSIANARSGVERFGQQIGLAFRRYGAFLIGGGLILRNVIGFFRSATQEALGFEKQVTRIQQVLDQTDKFAINIGKSVREASRATGTLASEIAEGTLAFAQSGVQNLEDLEEIVEQISKIPLSATFDDISSTSEGLIAIFGQFNKSASDTGEVLDLVNQFAADFAAESSDFFEAAKRGGAAFATAGGSLEDFVQLLSILRESTRESAATLGTFFKTGFAQLLSSKSQAQLRQLSVSTGSLTEQLVDLARVLNSDDFSSIERINIARQLTGDRQFARLLALLREINDPEVQARLANSLAAAPGSFDKSLEKRLDDIGANLAILRTNLLDFANALIQDQNIKNFISLVTQLSTALLDLTKSLTPLVPLLTLVAAPLVGKGISKGVTGAIGALGFNFRRNESEQQTSNRSLGFSQAQRGLGLIGSGLQKSYQTAIVNLTGSANSLGKDFDRQTRNFRELNLGVTNLTRGINKIIPNIGTKLGIAGIASGFIGGQVLGASSNQRTAAAGESLNSAVFSGATLSFLGVNPVLAALGGLAIGLKTYNDRIDDINRELEQRQIDLLRNKQRELRLENKPTLTADERVQNVLRTRAVGTAAASRSVQSILPSGNLSSFQKDLQSDIADLQEGFGVIEQALTGQTDLFNAANSRRLRSGNLNDPNIAIEQILEGLRLENDLGKNLEGILEEELKNILSLSDLIEVGGVRGADKAQVQGFVREQLLIFIQEFLGPLAGGGNAQLVLQQLLSDNLSAQFNSIQATNVKSATDPLILELNNFRSNIINFTDSLQQVNENFNRDFDALNSIITDPLALNPIQAPTNNDDLFRSFGLDTFVDSFITTNENISDQIVRFLESNRNVLSDFFNSQGDLEGDISTAEGLDQTLKSVFSFGSIQGAEEIQALVDQFISEFGDSFNILAQSGNLTFFELFAELVGSTDLDATVAGLRNTQEAEEALASTLRRNIEIFNRRLEIERQLATAVLNTEITIGQLTQQLQSLELAASQSAFEQEAFVRGFTAVQKAFGQANLLLGAANQSQFGGTEQFIQETLDVARRAFNDQRSLSGNTGRSFDESQRLAQQASNSQQDLLRAQAFLGQRLTELAGRVEAAANAAQILRQAYEQQRASLQSFGSSISQVTSDELGKTALAFQKFRQDGEIRNRKQFDLVTKFLASAGDLDIGGGVSASSLLAQLNENLAIPALSAITGQSTQVIRQSLEDLKTQQEAAAALEQQLRDEERQLVQLQTQLAQEQLLFFKDQQQLLTEISASLGGDDIKKITEQVNKLFANPLPVTTRSPAADEIRRRDLDSRPSPNTSRPSNNIPNITPPAFPIRRDINPNIPFELPTPNRGIRPDLTPNIPIRANPPRDIFETPQRPEIIYLNAGVQTATGGIGQDTELTRSINAVGQLLQRLSDGGLKSILEISPINVNVQLAAPDFVKTLGPQIKMAIMQEISVKLSSIFEDSPEIAGRISSEL